MKIFIFLILGLAELESWRIEVYQSLYYDLRLKSKIKKWCDTEKRSENQCRLCRLFYQICYDNYDK